MSPSITNSTTVDERVVEMRIDNSKFEDGANKTIGILEKLDKALHLHAETDEIDKLTNAVGKFDVSPMANGLDSLQSHFTALEIAGMRVISNLTDSVYNFTAKTIKDFTIEPITQGWQKFGDKTTAVATLKAQGYELEKVNKLMEDLNWFTDETSYNFTDMVGNIAKFTATGQDLDKSVTAMEGIALWAALSGQGAQKASMAMYQLSQAMGKGVLKYDDFKSIQNASMDTVEFRQQAVKAAEALGKLKKVGEDTWATVGDGAKDAAKAAKIEKKIRDTEIDLQYALQKQGMATTESAMLSAEKSVTKLQIKLQDLYTELENLEGGAAKGAYTLSELFSSDRLSRDMWFTDDVMMSVFNNYAKGVKEIQRYMDDNDIDTASVAMQRLREEATELAETVGITLDEAFKKLGYDIDEFSLKAFEAGQQARTWKDVVDSVKDAVSTGWMNTFEIMFGDADKATKFWTNMANQFWTLFASGGESRNNILKVAMGTAENIQEAVDYVSESMSFSPKTGEVVEGIKAIEEETKNLKPPVEETIESWDALISKINEIGGTEKEFSRALTGIIGLTSVGKSVDYTNADLIKQYGSLQKAFEAGAISAKDLSSALDLLSNSKYRNLWREYSNLSPVEEIGDESYKRGSEILRQMRLIENETLVIEGRNEEVRARWAKAIEDGFGENYDIDGLISELDEAERNVKELADLSAWDKLEREVNQNGRTMADFQDALDKILYENKAVELNALIEKYGSLEEALKSGEIEAGEFYEALVQLRSGNGVSEAADDIEQSTTSAIHSLEELKEVARGVLRGDYGNGEDRRRALEALGYNYDLVQGIAEIMYNGGQGYVGVTEELLRNEYPTFYAMLQDQIALNEEYAESWDTVINSEEEAADLLNEFQSDMSELSNSSSYSPKTNGPMTAMDRALAPYQAMLSDLESELNDAYREYADIERAIAENGIEGYEDALKKSAKRIDDITSQIDAVTEKIRLIKLDKYVDIEGYELFTNTINRVLDILVKVKETASEAMENVFGDDVTRGLKLKLVINDVHDFVQQITMSEDAIDGVRKVFEGFFSVIRIGGRILGIAAQLFGNLAGIALRFIDKIFSLIGIFDGSRVISTIDGVLDIISEMIDVFTNFLDNAINGEASQSFFKFLGDIFSNIAIWFRSAKGYVTELINFLEPALGLLATAAAGITGWVFMSALNLIISAVDKVQDAYNSITKWASESKVFQNTWNGILNTFNKISSSLEWGWNYVKNAIQSSGLTGAMSAFWEWVKAISRVQFPRIANFFGAIGDTATSIAEVLGSKLTFDSLPNALNSIVTILGNGLSGLGGLISVVFGGFLTLVTGVLQGLQGVNFDTEKISESFNNFYEIVKLVFNGLFGDPTEFKERITNFVLEAWSGFKAALEQISIRDAIKALRLSFLFAIGAKIMSVLSMVKKIGDEAATIPESLSWSIKRGGKMLEDIGKSFQANALIKMAAAVIMVSMALYGLSRINEDKLTHAAAVISVVMIILTMLVNSTRKATVLKNVDIKKFQVFGTVGSALIGLGVAIAAFTYAVFKIANAENPQRLAIAAVAIIVLIGIITTIIGVFAAKLVKSNANWERLKNIGMIMSRLGGAFLSISISIGMLVLPILAFTAAAAILEKNQLSASHVWFAAIAVMGLIMALGLAVSMIMKSMETLNDNQIKNAGGALLRIGGSIAIMSLGLNMFMLPFFALAGICVALVAFGVDLAPVWDAFKMFGLIFIGLAGFVTVITAILTKKTMSPERIKALGQTLLRMSASVALVAIGMNKMVNAFLKVLIVASVLKKFNMEVDFATAAWTLTGIAAGILGIVGILAKISTMKGLEPKRLLALAAIITALGVAFLFLTPAIIGLGAVIAILVYFASSLKNFDDVVRNMSKLAGTLLKISGAAILFGLAMLSLGVGTLAASISIGILAVAFLAVVKAIDLLAVHQDAIFAFFKALKSYFTVDNIWTVTKMTIVLSGFIILLLALTKRLKEFAIAWKVISAGGSIGEKLTSGLGKFGQNIPNLLHGAFTKVTGYLSTHADDIIPALGVIITIIGGYLTGIIPTLSKQLVVAVVTLLSSLASELKSNKDVLVDSLTSIANVIFDVFSEVLNNVLVKGFKDANWIGKILRVIAGAGLTAGIFKMISALINFVFASTRMGAWIVDRFTGKSGKGITNIGGKAGAVINVGSAVINVANGNGGLGGNGGSFLLPGDVQKTTKQSIMGASGFIAAETATVMAGMTARNASDAKRAAEALPDLIADKMNAPDATQVDALIQTISELKNGSTLITNINDEDMDEQDVDRALRTNQKALELAYEELAKLLNVSVDELKKRELEASKNGRDLAYAVDKIENSTLTKILKTIAGTGVKEDAINAMLDMGKMLSTDENLKGILNTNLQSAGLGQNLDETIGHLLSGQASIPAVQAALIATLKQAYNDPALHDQVADILKRSGLSEDLNTALKELGLEAVKNSQYTQAFVQSLTDIANDPTVKSQIETKYPEVGKLINNAISGSISKDDINAKLVAELAALGRDPELMQAINASCPEFGQFISGIIAQNIQNNDIAVGIVEALREAMEKPEIKNDIMARYPELGKLITDSVAGSISKDDLSPEILAQLTAITHDPQVLADINAAYPELGKQITNAILDGITIDDLAKEIVGKVNTIYNSELTQTGLEHGSAIGATIASDLVPSDTQLAEAIQSRDWATLIDLAAQNLLPADSQYAELYGAYQDIAGAIPEGSAAGIIDNLSFVNGALDQMALGEADYFAQLLQINSPSKIYSAIAESIPEGVEVGIASKSYLALNAVAAMARNMQAPFQRVFDRFSNFGAQAVRGVVNGINSNMQAAYNAGVSLANSINKGYTDTLKIKSPSRVFEALSMYVPMGAANGIMKGIPIAVAAASDLGNAIADEAASAMSTMAYVASDQFNFSPSITPVVDFDGAYSGLERLDRILADNPVTMNVGTNPSQRRMPQNATNYTLTNQNKDVVQEIHNLSERMTQLGQEITNMKIVLNSGVLVGEMAPAMNAQLGVLSYRERRQ